MKIDMISEHASPLAALGGADAGGQNVHVAALGAALARRGHEVTVFTRRDDHGLPDTVPLTPGLTVVHVPAGPACPLPKDDLYPHMKAFGSWLADRWQVQPPDAAHAHFWMSGLAAVPAARRSGVPVVQTFHALGQVKQRYQAGADTSPPQRAQAEAALARTASAVIATCTDEVRELAGYRGQPDRRYVIPCGVDGQYFRPDGPVAPRGPAPRLLTLSRLVPRKGVATVIEALARLPDAELVVAGGPAQASLDDDPEIRRLRHTAATAGVLGRVTFTGRVNHDDVPALFRSADIVVSDPWYEPFGMVPLEAMACGVAVVASAVGGHLDTITDQVTGLLVPPRDPAALARLLRGLIDSPAHRLALGIAGACRVRARYTWDQIAAETETVYARLRREWPAGVR